jgi:hypothetical protein
MDGVRRGRAALRIYTFLAHECDFDAIVTVTFGGWEYLCKVSPNAVMLLVGPSVSLSR